jgi:4-amino-4-deoxy-L-arabinose transferase-like glycosyltransferase
VSRSALPLIVLALLTFFVGLGTGAITDSDEAFYAEAAREMVERGDWLTPHFNGEPRFQKPILYYWATAATYLVLGPSELAARWWSACSGVGLVLVTAACGRRWYDEETGVLAGAIVATNFGYFALARMALPDLPLAFFITLAIFGACMATLERTRSPRGWVFVSTVALGLGLLTKGPVALVLPAIVVLPLILIERRRLTLSVGDVLTGATVVLLIGVPWYAAMWWEHGPAYLESFFIGDNLERFARAASTIRVPVVLRRVLAGGLLP